MLFRSESVPMHLLTPVAVSIVNTDIKAFTQLTRETLHDIIREISEAYDRWQAGVQNGGITKDAFEQTCIMYGWNYTPANVILNASFKLDMPRMIMYDWAHIYVHDGLADHELGLSMKVLQKENVGTSYLELGTYLTEFTFPKSCTNVAHLFTAEKNANKLQDRQLQLYWQRVPDIGACHPSVFC